MIASKGGVSLELAEEMPVSKRRMLIYALAQCSGDQIDWVTGDIRPPKAIQEANKRAKERPKR
jgi:hypothetical protein